MTVVKGKAGHRSYAFTGGRVDIGRRADVLDGKQRLVRTNHVAFDEEGAAVNTSVSRRHAHVTYETERREYRLHDDRSAHGTAIVRGGRTIPVHAGSRGVRLESGDEVLLGQARMRVTIE
jgi:pSer/pThr/pTyr-binding forkhead associated (FHA) protein